MSRNCNHASRRAARYCNYVALCNTRSLPHWRNFLAFHRYSHPRRSNNKVAIAVIKQRNAKLFLRNCGERDIGANRVASSWLIKTWQIKFRNAFPLAAAETPFHAGYSRFVLFPLLCNVSGVHLSALTRPTRTRY